MTMNVVIFSDLYFMMNDPFKSQKSRLFTYYIFIILTVMSVYGFPYLFGESYDSIFDDLDYYWAVALISLMIISSSVIYTILRLRKHGTS